MTDRRRRRRSGQGRSTGRTETRNQTPARSLIEAAAALRKGKSWFCQGRKKRSNFNLSRLGSCDKGERSGGGENVIVKLVSVRLRSALVHGPCLRSEVDGGLESGGPVQGYGRLVGSGASATDHRPTDLNRVESQPTDQRRGDLGRSAGAGRQAGEGKSIPTVPARPVHRPVLAFTGKWTSNTCLEGSAALPVVASSSSSSRA